MGVVVIDYPPHAFVQHGKEGSQRSHPGQLHDMSLRGEGVRN